MANYPIDFVSKSPSTERLTLTHKQTVTESSFTMVSQTIHGGSQWTVEWTWPRMSHRDGENVVAWIDSLKGQAGTFRYAPRQSVVSNLSGRTLTLEAYGQNNTVRVGGWAANTASELRTGQLFQIGDQLLRIVAAPVTANGSGTVDIEFQPALRKTYTVNTTVNFINPKGIFRLSSSEGMGYGLDPDRAPEFGTMTAKEVV